MAIIHWEFNLARRVALISLIGGSISWALRQMRTGLQPDFLTVFLSGYLLVLASFIIWRVKYQIMAAVMTLAMMVIGLWVSSQLIEPRPGPLLVILTAITMAAAYFRFRITFALILVSTVTLVIMGHFVAERNADKISSLPLGMTLFASWLSVCAGFATTSTIVAALISFVVTKMEQSLAHTQHLLQEAQRREKILEDKERLLKLFTELSSDYVYQVNLKNQQFVPQIFAGSFERITGYTLDELEIKGGWLAIVHPDDRESMESHMPALLKGKSIVNEYRIVSAAGDVIWLRDHVRPITDAATGVVTELLGAVHDITERKLAEEQIENLAFYDPLTTLPNRRLLLDRLEQAMALSQRTGQRGALLFIDLDNFKNLNDTKGHEAGDQLLIQQARRLRLCVREGDTVARLGGDEFIIILGELQDGAEAAAEEASAIAQQIVHALSLPVALTYRAVTDYENTCSIGVALFLGHEQSVDELLRRADLAMYQAKADGRNTFRFYDPAMQSLLSDRLELEEELKHALAQEQLLVYLQPQVTRDNKLVGAEILLRWLHPEKGMISPLQFIPTAERTGAIVAIGNWVLEEACHILRSWAEDPQTQGLTLSVNVSARQFRQDDFTTNVSNIIRKTGASPTRLKLELTESLALENVGETITKMQVLRMIGVELSLDDFGTGQSSLSYLKQLPLNQLKIDQSFTREISTDTNDAILVQTIIGMAHNLKLDIIAEGVETEEQLEFLATHGCAVYQGFLFGKPMPQSEFSAQYFGVS